MTLAADHAAPTTVPVLDAVAERWSTRVFDDAAPIDEAGLASALEAARWASSAFNTQPWRFIVARRGTDTHAKVLSSLIEFNRGWANAAGALVVFLVEATDESGKPVDTAAYDVGQAAGFFAVQAHTDGLHTHQMSGFSADAVREAFDIEARLEPITVIAIGSLGDLSQAPEKIRERETAPRTRRPLADSVLLSD